MVFFLATYLSCYLFAAYRDFDILMDQWNEDSKQVQAPTSCQFHIYSVNKLGGNHLNLILALAKKSLFSYMICWLHENSRDCDVLFVSLYVSRTGRVQFLMPSLVSVCFLFFLIQELRVVDCK
jgi:hypothetical protein